MADKIGEDNLTEEEKGLKKAGFGLLQFEEIFSRYDRFNRGVDRGYNNQGQRVQVGPEILGYINEIAKNFLEGELEKEKRQTIKSPNKSAMEDRKDNYEKRPSEKLKKKRWTSDGHMRN